MAQETRLQVFRLLLNAGPDGLPAGEVARRLGTPHNTMSTHLAILARAGLARSRRDSRQVIYAVELEGAGLPFQDPLTQHRRAHQHWSRQP